MDILDTPLDSTKSLREAMSSEFRIWVLKKIGDSGANNNIAKGLQNEFSIGGMWSRNMPDSEKMLIIEKMQKAGITI